MTPPDPVLLRGLTQRRMSRRGALALGGAAVASAAFATGALAGCDRAGRGGDPANPGPKEVAEFWAGKADTGHVDFANWPLYMAPEHTELAAFTEDTGITVSYREVISDMVAWSAEVTPKLAAGGSIGYDLMVITNSPEFNEFVAKGFLAPLDHSRLLNFRARAAAKYRTEDFDRGNAYSVPWASGMTGIAYDPRALTVAPTSLADLWNPKYAGRVGMFAESAELGNFGMLALGISPETSTPQDWLRAADRLRQQRDAGIVREYYDQDYIDALGNGDIWLCQAWSGDVFQKNVTDGTNLKFIIPREGGTIWTDNMTIPVTAANPVGAIALMDFFYRVDIAASLTTYINYITPVPEAQHVIAGQARSAQGEEKEMLLALANSGLVFPTGADYARLHYYRSLPTAGERKLYQETFEAVSAE